MYRFLKFTAALFAMLPCFASAQFIGDLRLAPMGCESIGQCTLLRALSYKDAKGLVWEAKAGLITDGASIPGVFQPLIGLPFDERFIKAAVIHDHYCDRHVRSWRTTHRVFYEALLDQGVSMAKAKTMYFAVVVGGQKWIKLIPSNNCGKNCVNNIKSASGVAGYRSRNADFSLPSLPPALKDTYELLEIDPEALSLDQLDIRARDLRPGDFYFANGDQIVVVGQYVTE